MINPIRVFVSYSWDSEAHKEAVRRLTNQLRSEGYDAEMDDSLRDKETAVNFTRMTHTFIPKSDKVILVLSEGYKKKATDFSGGVGKEYMLVLNEIDKLPKKYILVSFGPNFLDLAPIGLAEREVVNVSTPSGFTMLLHKLSDQPQFTFSPVAPDRKELTAESIPPFQTGLQHPIEAQDLRVFEGNASKQNSLFTTLERTCSLEIKNISGKPVGDYNVVIKVPDFLVRAGQIHQSFHGFVVFEMNGNKLFAQQVKTSEEFPVVITRYTISKAMTASIKVSIFTDSGEYTRSFPIIDYIKLPTDYGSKESLSEEKFGGW